MNMRMIQLTFFILVMLCVQAALVTAANAGETASENNQPEVVFETSKGSFTLKLDPVKAPRTVDNFLKYVDDRFYDNTIFHRAIPGFVVQGGGFEKGMHYKKPHAPVKNESANRLKNNRGTISMARRTHPDTATSQFYINLADNTRLDYKSRLQPGYTVFGVISEGMEVVDKIAGIQTHNVGKFRDVPVEDVVVLSAKRKVDSHEAPSRATDNTGDAEGGITNMQADSAVPYIEGEHYTVLDKPVPTRDGNKIEVVEMFSYGCPHCYAFEADVKSWGGQQADDVDFWFFPAVWNEPMKLYAKAFYTAHELNLEDKIHQPLFHAIVVEQKSIKDENDLATFFSNYGVDNKTFKETFYLEKVEHLARQAEERVLDYRPVGVPEIVVNGKYRIGRMRAGGLKEMLAVADFLVNKERSRLINDAR